MLPNATRKLLVTTCGQLAHVAIRMQKHFEADRADLPSMLTCAEQASKIAATLVASLQVLASRDVERTRTLASKGGA